MLLGCNPTNLQRLCKGAPEKKQRLPLLTYFIHKDHPEHGQDSRVKQKISMPLKTFPWINRL